ncbi:MAG: Rieske 2Fe-2S domain-containing protein [Candidatus Nanopelagicales bacterium]|nr:Rieske 2Fe-2S domain-containing protein [Candidatus Nanopelagicales bacterium]
MTDITPHGSQPAKLGHSPVADVPHVLRAADTNPKAAKRAERQVASMFLLSIVLVIAFIVSFVTIDKDTVVYIPVFGEVGLLNIMLGLTSGLSIFLIGAGAIQWAKKLMPDVEVVQMRHEMTSPADATAEAAANYERGKEESGFVRYPIIRRTLIGAMALFPIPALFLLRDLWSGGLSGKESPDEILSHTIWRKGERIVVDTPANEEDLLTGPQLFVKPEDLPVGGLVSAVPASLREVQHHDQNLNARGKAAIILVRMDPSEIVAQQGDGWDYQGIVAYSKICTHVGCPIALYEQRTHHLLCPCHQSTFDLANAGAVVFGPAARNMPQLPIGVDDEGYLVALADFAEPVGPSFWERG